MIYQLDNSGLGVVALAPQYGRRSLGRFAGARLRGQTTPRNLATLEEYKLAHLAALGLGDLGISAGQAVGASAPIAGAVTTAALSSAFAGSAIGAWAGPIGAGVGAIVGIIGGLYAAHAARAKGAKSENEAVNAFLPAFDQGLKTIFQQANSGQLSGSDAITAVDNLWAQWWANMAPYQSGPGRADSSKGGTQCGSGQINPAGPCQGTIGGHKCDKSCTAGCCVGCQALYQTVLQAVQVFQNPAGGTITACSVSGSSYGASARGSYTLTYTPPAGGSVAGVSNALSSALSGSSGSSGTLLLLGLAAAGLYFATR